MKFHQYMNIMPAKYIGLITLSGGLLENKHVPYEGLVVVETSNAQHGMFSFKTQPLQPNASILKPNKYQNTNIYMDFSEISPKSLH